MAKILVLHGPNLNLLGTREPAQYGSTTLADINKRLAQVATENRHELSTFQSNGEHELIQAVQKAPNHNIEFIITNPAALTHSSVALRDAFAAVRVPFIEVHLTNTHAREPFRRKSYFSDLAQGVICGFGAVGYEYALLSACQYLAKHAQPVSA